MSVRIKRVLRIGIAVKDLDQAVANYKKLFGVIPFSYGTSETDKSHWWACEVGEGDCIFELMAPMNDPQGESQVSKFIRKRGEGLYHIMLQTADNADTTVDTLRESGVEPTWGSRFWNNSPLNASGDTADTWQEHYLHPKDTHGIMLILASITRKLQERTEMEPRSVPVAGTRK